jgi:tetratricopeptide (TPR) repeat protein
MRQSDPRSEALSYYQSGQRRLDKIGKIAEELKTADAAKAVRLQEKMRKGLEAAAGDFRRAVQNDPNLFQAHSELGFTLRKLGKYDESLAAYDRALSLQPNFAPAIEYRAEAHLGLNRLDEAKEAYLLLFSGDRPRADLLFEAMKAWVAEHRDDPSAATFAAWIEQRQSLHQGTPTATSDLRTW